MRFYQKKGISKILLRKGCFARPSFFSFLGFLSCQTPKKARKWGFMDFVANVLLPQARCARNKQFGHSVHTNKSNHEKHRFSRLKMGSEIEPILAIFWSLRKASVKRRNVWSNFETHFCSQKRQIFLKRCLSGLGEEILLRYATKIFSKANFLYKFVVWESLVRTAFPNDARSPEDV